MKGVAVMKNLKLSYYPNSNLTLKITASNILKFYDEFLKNKYIYEINENMGYDYLINFNFRRCVDGEIYRPESQMYFLKYYSL